MPPFISVLPPMTTHHANNHAYKNKRRRKQSSRMEQFQRSRKLYNQNHLDKVDPISKSNHAPTWLQTAKDNIRIPKHNTKQKTSHNGSTPLSYLSPHPDQFNLLLAVDSRSESTPFYPNSLSSLLNHPFMFPTC